MDLTSPTILKVKGALFVVLGLLSAVLLLQPFFSWRALVLFSVSVWAFCRAYYFCFHVMQHYVEPGFRFAGMVDLLLHLSGVKKQRASFVKNPEDER